MDFTQFLPRETHKPLSWLGKHPGWLQTSVAPDGAIKFQWKFPDADKGIGSADYEFIDVIRNSCAASEGLTTADRLLGLFYRAAAASLANGPKMFQPTPIQCEALENVDVDVPFEDYRQPYETLIIQLPQEYRRDAMARHNLTEFPSYAICHHDLRSNIITVACNYDQRKEGETIVAVLRPQPGVSTIEEEFRKEELKNEPLIDRIIQRLAVNICLLMTHYRTRTRPLDPKYLEKLRALAKKKDPQKAERAQKMLPGQIMVVEFEQSIAFHDVEDEELPPGEITEVRQNPGGYSVRPHWRRGHWRRQSHGAKWIANRREDDGSVVVDETHHRVFIKPILVRKSVFAGDKSQTSVLYKGGTNGELRATPRPAATDAPVQKGDYGG